MNIPEVYLIEPYNAYAPKGRKKHWHEVIEEQALLAKIIAEQQALQEASSKTLPPNSPEISTPTIGGTPVAGGGGMLPPQAFGTPVSGSIGFTASPTSGVGPLTVTFTNTTPNSELYTYLWTFSNSTGTIGTSTLVNPVVVFQSGSLATNTVTASLLATSSVFGTGIGTSSLAFISASKPFLSVTFSLSTSSLVAPYTTSFTSIPTYTGNGTLTYLWTFGSASLTSASQNASNVYTTASSFTASLQVTESSYQTAVFVTGSFFVPAPTLVAAYTVSTSSNSAPSTATFTNTTTYNGSGTLEVTWSYGSGSLTSNLSTPPPLSYTTASSYTSSLAVTESLFSIKSFVTRSFRIL